MRKILLLWVLSAIGCTPLDHIPITTGGGGANGCKFVFSEAVTANGTCTAQGGWGDQSSDLSFTVASTSASTSFTFATILSMTDHYSTGTYTTANVVSGGAQYHVDTGAAWALVDAATNGDPPNQGDFTLKLNSTGAVTQGDASKVWLDSTGTLSVDMPAVPNSSATGTIHVEVTF